ncbi:cupin domain-containing protein [Alysiella crassa]|uniref:Right origin-binding protein n=1 Tax=Alysiella crassa TaxID=153491 RepID=A0A376BNA0_9NEIS|nr:AraC family transcriptional regulator [Alysiella crassa]SSY71140.1 Right origin-binding protein [Alysiella crassa]
MDSLAKLIQLAQITGSINTLCQFKGEWFVHHTHKRTHGMIHFVTNGEGWLQIDKQVPQMLKTGDLIVLPRSIEHILSSDSLCNNTHAHIDSHQQGAFTIKSTHHGSQELNLFCANFAYEPHTDLFNGLPEVLYLDGQSEEFQHIISLLKHEALENRAASEHILNSLLQILLIHILRHYFNQPQAHLSGVLNGLQDKRLRGVVSAVLAQPAKEWSVEHMSEQAHLSRAQLMRLFKQHIGMSPHAFVNHIRLQVAAQLLRTTADSVLQIALSVGFQSETHFGKVFKKQYGMPPGVYRKSTEESKECSP